MLLLRPTAPLVQSSSGRLSDIGSYSGYGEEAPSRGLFRRLADSFGYFIGVSEVVHLHFHRHRLHTLSRALHSQAAVQGLLMRLLCLLCAFSLCSLCLCTALLLSSDYAAP